jgi:hypothetical protein
MKRIILFIAFIGLILSTNAQDILKLKTIKTYYGGIDGNSNYYRVGDLDGAVINADSFSRYFSPELCVVNVSNDTFSFVTMKMTMDILLYDDRDSLLTMESATPPAFPVNREIFPHDTVEEINNIRISLLATIDNLKEEENIDLEQISYWKIITGISYTSKDGTYSERVFYEGADTSIFRVVRGDVDIQEIEQKPDVFSIYPNPTNGLLRIMNDGLRNANIEIFDITGKLVKIYSPINNTIDISELQTGMYFITIYNEKQKITKKFAKQ